MSELLEQAPADTAPPVVATEPAPLADGTPKPRPPVDLDARLEEVLAESRRVSDLDKAVAARLLRAEEMEARWKPRAAVDEHLTKGQRAEAIRALLDGKIDEQLLMDLATHVPTGDGAEEPKKELSLEDQVKAIVEAREKLATEAKEKADKDKADADAKAAGEQMSTFMTGSAKFLKENLAKYPFIQAWGCDSARYTTLLIEHAEKTGQMPEAAALLDLVEAEHKARWLKAPGAPKDEPEPEDLDQHVARAYQQNRPAVPVVEDTRPKSAYELAKAELDAYDREQRERVRYGQGR